jgi:hypothetical protein
MYGATPYAGVDLGDTTLLGALDYVDDPTAESITTERSFQSITTVRTIEEA